MFFLFLSLEVSIGLFWFYSVSFSFNGVYFLWFIFNRMLSVSKGKLIFNMKPWVMYLSPKMYICQKSVSKIIVLPKELYFPSPWEPFWLTMTSLTERFHLLKHSPLYENKQNERNVTMEATPLQVPSCQCCLSSCFWSYFSRDLNTKHEKGHFKKGIHYLNSAIIWACMQSSCFRSIFILF